MASSESKLSPELIAQLSKKNSLGTGYRALADWLFSEHGIKLSHVTINNKIKLFREDNFELTKELRAEKKEQLSIHIDNDLELLQHEIDKLMSMAKDCVGKKDNRLRLSITDRVVKLIDLRRKFCGVQAPEEEVKVETSSDVFLSRLDDLVERRKADKEAKDSGTEIVEPCDDTLR